MQTNKRTNEKKMKEKSSSIWRMEKDWKSKIKDDLVHNEEGNDVDEDDDDD